MITSANEQKPAPGITIAVAVALLLAFSGITAFAYRAYSSQNSARPSSVMNIDKDEGLGKFYSYPCDSNLCARVQLNATADEADLPVSIGRYITRLVNAVQNKEIPIDPHVGRLRLQLFAFHVGADGQSQSVPWGVVDVTRAALLDAPRDSDFDRNLELVHEIRFANEEGRQTATAYCAESANLADSPHFCALVSK